MGRDRHQRDGRPHDRAVPQHPDDPAPALKNSRPSDAALTGRWTFLVGNTECVELGPDLVDDVVDIVIGAGGVMSTAHSASTSPRRSSSFATRSRLTTCACRSSAGFPSPSKTAQTASPSRSKHRRVPAERRVEPAHEIQEVVDALRLGLRVSARARRAGSSLRCVGVRRSRQAREGGRFEVGGHLGSVRIRGHRARHFVRSTAWCAKLRVRDQSGGTHADPSFVRRRIHRDHRGRSAAWQRVPRRRRTTRSRHHRRGTFAGQGVASVYYAPLAARLRADGYQPYIFGLPAVGLGDAPRRRSALNTFVDGVRAQTGAAKVNLIGHSQGGMVSRYYIKYLGGANEVDSLVNLAAP